MHIQAPREAATKLFWKSPDGYHLSIGWNVSSFQGCGQLAFIRAQRPSLKPVAPPCDNNRHLISSDLTLLSSPSLYPHLPQPTPTPTTTITPYRMDNLTLITAPYPRPRPNECVPSAVAGGASTWPPASPHKKKQKNPLAHGVLISAQRAKSDSGALAFQKRSQRK